MCDGQLTGKGTCGGRQPQGTPTAWKNCWALVIGADKVNGDAANEAKSAKTCHELPRSVRESTR